MIDLNKYLGLEVILISKTNDKYVGIISKDNDGYFKLNVDDENSYYISQEVIKSITLTK